MPRKSRERRNLTGSETEVHSWCPCDVTETKPCAAVDARAVRLCTHTDIRAQFLSVSLFLPLCRAPKTPEAVSVCCLAPLPAVVVARRSRGRRARAASCSLGNYLYAHRARAHTYTQYKLFFQSTTALTLSRNPALSAPRDKTHTFAYCRLH